MHLHSLVQLRTPVQQFAALAENPYPTWDGPVDFWDGYMLWQTQIGRIDWSLERKSFGYKSKFRLRPSTFPSTDDYMAIEATKAEDGSLRELVIAAVIKSTRASSVPPRVIYVHADLHTEEVNLYTQKGTTKIRTNVVGNPAFRVDNLPEVEDRLVQDITCRTPLRMLKDELVVAS
jgi:hypothetical protein